MRRVLFVLGACAPAGLFACSSVLGYDDVSFDGGSAGVSARGGNGGSAAGGPGGSGVGGSNAGGSNAGGTGTGGSGFGGAAPQGGASGAGVGGTGTGGAGVGGSGGAGVGGASGAGVGGSSGAGVGGASGSGVGGSSGSGIGGASGSGVGGSSGSGVGGSSGSGGSGGMDAATVCARWKSDRVDLSEGTWSGNVASCVAGDISANGRANALRLVNLYRWIAGLPAVTNDPTRDQGAQACALMMDANNQLSHTPPTNWLCYTTTGADTAGKSNISGTPGVAGVDLYMTDPGNETTIGHRRWILSNSLGPIGLGSTSQSSCLWVTNGTGRASKVWTAWPPPGVIPFEAFHTGRQTLDQTGWTIESDSVTFTSAQVQINDGGTNLPVTVTQLGANYGSRAAIKFLAQGWQAQAGHTYSVTVSGASQPISYSVQVVACN